ncbi:MAG TPA: tetratricopeptide repeat protein [Anaeromyxobacteraceae bacterium]|nr:tetratricopeptide repeat protein [Anaeromyxobacteraceae bacterium]
MNDSTDPRGWLQACPELNQFASDRDVAAAIAAGDARKLAAALERRRKGKRGAIEARAIDAILARRRLFAVPVAKAPSLHTLNGIGSRIYGKSDVAPDGSYVGTLFFTLLFLPIWPIAQYVLWSQGNQYTFLGEIPLSRGMRAWRRIAAVAALAGAAAIGFAVWRGGTEAEVVLLNGLDVQVAVEAPGGTTHLAPGARRTARIPVGKQRLRTTAPDGRAIEELVVDVPSWTDLVVYNPLGAAPLYVDPVVYVAKGKAGPARPPTTTLYAGRPFAVRDDVQYAFRTAPATIEMGSSQDHVTHWKADVLEGGWRSSLEALGWEGRVGEAAELAARVARASPDVPEAHLRRISLANWARGPEEALAAAREAAAAFPGEADVQRQLAFFLLATGRREEAMRAFRERAAREPDSPLAGYLRARLEPVPVAVPAFETLVRRFPGDANAHRGLAWAYLSAGRPADAGREFEALARTAPEAAEGLLSLWALALVRAGRVGDALSLVSKRLEKDPSRWDHAILYGQLARLEPSPSRPPDRWVKSVRDGLREPWLATLFAARAATVLGTEPPPAAAVDEIPDVRSREMARILVAAAKDPEKAVALAAKAPGDALAMIPRGLGAALAGEAARRGDGKLAHRIATAAGVVQASEAEIVAFVRGESVEALDDPDPEALAGLLVGRARAAQAAGRDAGAILRAARAADTLRGGATQALSRWPKP